MLKLIISIQPYTYIYASYVQVYNKVNAANASTKTKHRNEQENWSWHTKTIKEANIVANKYRKTYERSNIIAVAVR